jgi:arginine deiminase
VERGINMRTGINVYSEIGKLNKVLLHRIGDEVEGLVPDNFERLLFDDIPYLKVAQEEHDKFADLLRANDVDVIYYVDETVKALKDKNVRHEFVKKFLDESEIYSTYVKDALEEYMMGMSVKGMVEKAIAGIKKSDITIKSNSLADYIDAGYPYHTDPLPNLYFTRDPGACIGNGVNIHHMSTLARRRESLLLEYMYKYNKSFAPEGSMQWYDFDDSYSIEGGDVLVLNKDIVAIGLSQRTSVVGIEHFAKNILTNSNFKKIIVFDIPKRRAFMHLDTVFTMVDYDKFTIHPEIEGPLQLYEITIGNDGHAHFSSLQDELANILKHELKLPAVELIRCGGDDPQAAQREQWNDGSNTLAIAPGKVVTYERNYVTNDLLDKKGVEVLTIPSSALSRGRGGPRCMSCPVHRDDL